MFMQQQRLLPSVLLTLAMLSYLEEAAKQLSIKGEKNVQLVLHTDEFKAW